VTESIVRRVLLSSIFVVALVGCESARVRECTQLLDVKARLARDVHTHPDPKTPSETAQNWLDDGRKLQSERDALERLVFRDERLAIWASQLRDTLPIQSRLARRIGEAVGAGDAKTVAELQAEWDDRQKKIGAVTQDVDAYCNAR
jgi:hypothetical protein